MEEQLLILKRTQLFTGITAEEIRQMLEVLDRKEYQYEKDAILQWEQMPVRSCPLHTFRNAFASLHLRHRFISLC